jgi:hypothetical protein
MDLTLPSVVVRIEGSKHHNKDQMIDSALSVGTTSQSLLDKESTSSSESVVRLQQRALGAQKLKKQGKQFHRTVITACMLVM